MKHPPIINHFEVVPIVKQPMYYLKFIILTATGLGKLRQWPVKVV
jgi:hypothetical protein